VLTEMGFKNEKLQYKLQNFWIYSRRAANNFAVCQAWRFCSTGRQL